MDRGPLDRETDEGAAHIIQALTVFHVAPPPHPALRANFPLEGGRKNFREFHHAVVHCPVCGAEGDETDFHGGGQAHIRRPATHDPANVSEEAQRDYLFIRHNPKGLHFERWRCDRGCGKWFHAARDTVTMEFKAFYGITELPPREVMEQATGEWAAYFKDKLKADAKS